MQPVFVNSHYYLNGSLTETSVQAPIESNVAVYEVFRVIAGIPLFFEDHAERLNNSLRVAELHGFLTPAAGFLEMVNNLCTANNNYFGNMELLVAHTTQGGTVSLLGFVSHKYPEPANYINGVPTSLLKAERVNPNAKVKHTKTRLLANKFLVDNPCFEVLLTNNENAITEGSRSNLFFIKDKTVYTPPGNVVLPGISRKYAIQSAQSINIKVVEKTILKSYLNTYDAAFLCGTSIGVLPIKSIDKFSFNPQNALLRTIMQQFNYCVQNYLAAKSK